MRSWYPLAIAGSAAALALLVLVVVLVRAADDDPPPAANPTPTLAVTAEVRVTPTSASGSPSATPPSPTAASTGSPAPTRTLPAPTATPPAASGILVEHGNRSSKQIALTFDMGGRVEPALDIMNWLTANKVPATIFMTGAMAENKNTEAGREVLRIVAGRPDLFALGNHSYTHPDFRELTAEEMRSELSRTEVAVAKTTSASLRPWFRPPFGGHNAEVVRTVGAGGYGYTVMWDIDTIDWRPEADGGPTASQIVDKVVTRAQGGSIVLMHLGGYNTLAALPQLVAGVKAKGLEPVTLGTMFGQ